jgi:hypothetical protein
MNFELHEVVINCVILKKFTNKIKVSFQVSRQVSSQVSVLLWNPVSAIRVLRFMKSSGSTQKISLIHKILEYNISFMNFK